MADSPHLHSPDFAATLETACDDFHAALTRRWRNEVCAAALAARHDFPTVVRREVSPHAEGRMWEYWTVPAQQHLHSHTGCAYVRWDEAGQDGDLGMVRCDGATDVRDGERVEVPDPATGDMHVVPPRIECGMGSLLRLVADWAWGEREQVFGKLPLFAHHDVHALESAYDTFLDIGETLGLQRDEEDSDDGVPALTSIDDRRITTWVSDIAGRSSNGKDWWAGWTGLAAETVREGFFASTAPTLNNHSVILGFLANLYSDRAAVIVKARNDALQWLQWATRACGQQHLVTTDLTDEWKVLQGIGTTVAITGGWSGAGAAVGATVTLAAFLGENLASEIASQEDKHTIEEVIDGLHEGIECLNAELDSAESSYHQGVRTLRQGMYTLHNYDLELYDLTQNSPDGRRGPDDTGFEAEVDSVLKLAERCYRVGGEYEALLPRLAATADADRHLAGRDGTPTEADRLLLEIRELLGQFVKTTCARYLAAGDQVRRAAEAYVEVDEGERDKFDRVIGDWSNKEFTDYNRRFVSPSRLEETDRRYDLYSGLAERRGGYQPGKDAGEQYIVEDE